MPDPAAPGGAKFPIAWSAPVDVASGGGTKGPWRQNESNYDYVDDPTVALDPNGAAAVAWIDQRHKDVFFQIYEPGGKPRLKQSVNVSRTPRVFSWLPRLVLSPAHPNDVYILWQEIVFSGGSHGGEIFFARSRNGGAGFENPINLSNSIAGDGKGRINKDYWHNGSLDLAIGPDGTLYAAWTEYEGPLWLSRSNDRGERFSRPMLIAGGGNAKPARAPALAVGPDNSVHLAWTVGEDNGADIRVAKSVDAGRTFGEPKIAAATRGYSDAPKLTVDRKGTLHVAWAESVGGPFDRYHIHYTRSRDGGRTFESPRQISKTHPEGESGGFPALSADEQGRVFVSWELFPESRGYARGLAIAYSLDSGDTFSTPTVVPDTSDPTHVNGGLQGMLMRKLAVNGAGAIALVNSSLKPGERSRVWLLRAQPK